MEKTAPGTSSQNNSFLTCNANQQTSQKQIVKIEGRFWRIVKIEGSVIVCYRCCAKLISKAVCSRWINHSVCDECHLEFRTKSKFKCPECELTKCNRAVLNAYYNNIKKWINNAQISCVECDWEGEHSSIEGHMKTCVEKEHLCKFSQYGCQQKQFFDKLVEHMLECEYKPVDCTNKSDEIIPAIDSATHKNNLRKRPASEVGLQTTPENIEAIKKIKKTFEQRNSVELTTLSLSEKDALLTQCQSLFPLLSNAAFAAAAGCPGDCDTIDLSGSRHFQRCDMAYEACDYCCENFTRTQLPDHKSCNRNTFHCNQCFLSLPDRLKTDHDLDCIIARQPLHLGSVILIHNPKSIGPVFRRKDTHNVYFVINLLILKKLMLNEKWKKPCSKCFTLIEEHNDKSTTFKLNIQAGSWLPGFSYNSTYQEIQRGIGFSLVAEPSNTLPPTYRVNKLSLSHGGTAYILSNAQTGDQNISGNCYTLESCKSSTAVLPRQFFSESSSDDYCVLEYCLQEQVPSTA